MLRMAPHLTIIAALIGCPLWCNSGLCVLASDCGATNDAVVLLVENVERALGV